MLALKQQEYDVAVVGGGPAGTSAAYAAAAKGAKVILFEKESTIAETVRTSGVTWINEVKEFGIPQNCYNSIRNFSFQSPNNTVTITGNTEPTAAVLDVRSTYRWLASQAEKAGAVIMTGSTVNGVIKNAEQMIIGVKVTHQLQKIPDSTYNAKVIIDASGFSSAVCRAMGMKWQWNRFGAGAEYEAEVESVKPDTWWLMVGQEYSPAGYAWIFPTGKNTVRIGVGVGKPESDADPTTILKQLIAKKKGPIASLGNITTTEFHYGLIPNDGLVRETVYDNMILVGDSAGQANPLVLEGIRYAIRFGRMAGATAATAALTGQTSKHDMIHYENAWRNAIESRIKSAGKVQDRWINLTDKQWDSELDIIKDMTTNEFVTFIKAEFGMYEIAKMAARKPSMAAKQLFRLVSEKFK